MDIENFLKAKKEKKNIGKLINKINDNYENNLELLLNDILENLKTEEDIFLFFAQNANVFYAFEQNEMLYEVESDRWGGLDNDRYSIQKLIEEELFKNKSYSWNYDICIDDCTHILYVFKENEQYKKVSFEIATYEGTSVDDYNYCYKYETYKCVKEFFEKLQEKCKGMIDNGWENIIPVNALAKVIENKCTNCKYFTVCCKKKCPIYECEVLNQFDEKNKIKEITYL